jgi:hypothetical protein
MFAQNSKRRTTATGGATHNSRRLPTLVVHRSNLPRTAYGVRGVLIESRRYYDRDGPVVIQFPSAGGPPRASSCNANNVIMDVHSMRVPVQIDRKGKVIPITLPSNVAQMYLDMKGDLGLPVLNGICTSPLLEADGSIKSVEGYDASSKLWCTQVPELSVAEKPTHADAERELAYFRAAFRTFPFADSTRVWDARLGVDVVDFGERPGYDESAFLVALLTAVCRPSLDLAPGLLVSAPLISGAGTGKGNLVRGLAAIAFGIKPQAFTCGADGAELDKRLAAELIEGGPVLFLDNANSTTLRSDILASVMTECPARVRVLGQSRMASLNSSAFIAVTGNGVRISEDLSRRFIECQLDTKTEDAERRPFEPGFVASIMVGRATLLTSALTIWRWGRLNAPALEPGRPLGSFEKWAKWVRDPLLALGCRDPVERMSATKADDPQRQKVLAFFQAWWDQNQDRPITAAHVDPELICILDPSATNRQDVAAWLSKLRDARVGGFVLESHRAAGRWSPATYRLVKIARAA